MNPRHLFSNPLHIYSFLFLLTLNLSSSDGKPLNVKNSAIPSIAPSVIAAPQDQSKSASFFEQEMAAATSAERMKRQLFRDQIPHHRPLSGNLYAHHHGYPHPGRWHANQQQIVPANYNSGLHFDNPNVIITDDDFNKYGSTLQHIDNHRIRNNPAPILHEYPTEFAKVVPLDQSQGHGGQGHDGHELPVPLHVPIVATHHHIHHHLDGGNVHHHHDGGSTGGNAGAVTVVGGAVEAYPNIQQFDHVTHGHTVVHPGGSDYSVGPGPTTYTEVVGHSVGSSYAPQGGTYAPHGGTYSVPPQKSPSKPFFGYKLQQLLAHKMNFGGPLLKGFLPSGLYKRRSNSPSAGAISWTAVRTH